MIETHIDLEISVRAGPVVGRVFGSLPLVTVPTLGAAVSFLFPTIGDAACPSPSLLDEVRIEKIIFNPQPTINVPSVLIVFDPILVSKKSEAIEIAQYLQNAFNLKFEDW